MDPKAIIAALPMLRRAWKFLPPPLRVPVLIVAAVIGVFQFVTGRKAGKQRAAGGSGGAAALDGPPPAPRG